MTDVRLDLGDLQFHGEPVEFDVPCGVHCTKRQARRKYLEYVGPMKIVILDTPPVIYREQMYGNACIRFSYFAMGTAVSCIAIYTTAYKEKDFANCHILLCTFGYQLCYPVAFFLNNPIDPVAVWMTSRHRMVESATIRIFGAGLIFTSMALFLMNELKDIKSIESLYELGPLHTSFGTIALVASAIELLLLCFAYTDNFSILWKLVSVPALVSGSLAFCTGVLKPNILEWFSSEETPYFVIFFCVFYTLTAIYRPTMDVINEILCYLTKMYCFIMSSKCLPNRLKCERYRTKPIKDKPEHMEPQHIMEPEHMEPEH